MLLARLMGLESAELTVRQSDRKHGPIHVHVRPKPGLCLKSEQLSLAIGNKRPVTASTGTELVRRRVGP